MQQSVPNECLQVTNVAKTYRVFHSPSQRLKDLLGLSSRHHNVQALRPLSFSVGKGETVAIVGANGSGKSTLLQLICGTLTPSQGEIVRHGRIAALLELGAGFNPEFSGLDNIFLNASINGMARQRTEQLLPDILAFADIGDYVHQPVKTYSSGMYVRLAFAVAIHTEPDLLIIDEALAVGDEAFQRKCFARLRELQAQGVSILFVSHSAESVVALCDRALLLDHGELLKDGAPRQVVALYQKLLYAKPEQRAVVRDEVRAAEAEDEGQDAAVSCQSEPGAGHTIYPPHPYDYIPGMDADSTDFIEDGARIEEVMMLDEHNQRVNVLHKGQRYRYCYRVVFTKHARRVYCGNLVKRVDGTTIGGMSTTPPAQPVGIDVEAGECIEVDFRFRVTLNPGTYFINVGVHGAHGTAEGFLARRLDALMFKVVAATGDCATGTVDLGMTAAINRLGNLQAGV